MSKGTEYVCTELAHTDVFPVIVPGVTGEGVTVTVNEALSEVPQSLLDELMYKKEPGMHRNHYVQRKSRMKTISLQWKHEYLYQRFIMLTRKGSVEKLNRISREAVKAEKEILSRLPSWHKVSVFQIISRHYFDQGNYDASLAYLKKCIHVMQSDLQVAYDQPKFIPGHPLALCQSPDIWR